MPVTKKKGSLFAIYADTPDKSSSSASSSSSSLSIKTSKTGTTSPSKRSSSSSRKALTSLQPKALESTKTENKGKSVSLQDENSKSKISTSDLLPLKSKLSEFTNKSHTHSHSAPTKNRTKSSIQIFNDENSISVKTSRKIPTTTLKSSINTITSSPKSRKSAPTPLATSHNQSTKRTRDLLSPLPILDVSSSSGASHPRPKDKFENRLNDLNESPLKRNKISPSQSRNTIQQGIEINDKENIPPVFSPDSSNDSPASRTRSKIRSLTLSSGQSPLSSRIQSSRKEINKFGELIGDGKSTLTLKKGRELSGLLQQDLDQNLENTIKILQPSPTKKSGKSTSTTIKDIDMLGDVSEAYGAERNNEPEGFKTQRKR
uniref:Uncharacterized protein n=1 Tax=Kwoniella pini CBS 10737 TaxID=1296096 RepID=A0A1B9I9P2_9TREE|nr:uncharacterized protein I206_01499 [Kwoniella pini CBS 10737]OCF52213.1 hypothetical protein I206_01499 [Kwoniella pini CBS 10737]